MTHRRRRTGFTLIELLTVVAVIGILAGILIPSVGAVMERARAARSGSNLKQMFLGMESYAIDNKNQYPFTQEDGQWWFQTIYPFVTNEPINVANINTLLQSPGFDVMVCPGWGEYMPISGSRGGTGFGMNLYPKANAAGLGTPNVKPGGAVVRKNDITVPGNTVALGTADYPVMEVNSSGTDITQGKPTDRPGLTTRFNGSYGMFVFFDGHVEQIEPIDLYPKLRDPE